MRNYKFTLFFLILFYGVGDAQNLPNSIYAEVFGNAGGYSINYERNLYKNLSLRTGFMFLSNVSTFPMLVNYRIYSGRSYFSIGGGILNWHIYTNYKILGGDSIEGSGILLTA